MEALLSDGWRVPRIVARAKDGGQLRAQEAVAFPNRNPALQQKGADLIDNASSLADESLAETLPPRLVSKTPRAKLRPRTLAQLSDGLTAPPRIAPHGLSPLHQPHGPGGQRLPA